jgi:outer membrane lipoprotein SlyB
MIKETLSGFKDTMALEIGKIAAAKSASSGDSAGGLGSMLGAMAGGLAGAAAGGPANDTPESNTVAESN